MLIDDCSEFRGHRLKSCSRCGHQFDGLRLTRLNCDQLNAIKDKESQFGFKWKLSDWAVGEAIKVDVCPSCYADVVNLIDANEQVDKLTVGHASERPDFLAKQLNIPMRLCPFCNEHKPKGDFYKVPDHVVHSFVMRSTIYTRDKKQTQQFLNSIYSPDGPMVCSDCVAFMNERFGQYFNTEHQDFLAKQLNIPMCNCQICHKELPKHEFVDIQPEHYIASDILTNPDDYFLRWPKSKKQSFLDILSRSAYVKVCPQCYSGLCHEYLCNESRRLKLEPYSIALNELHDKLPVYIKGKSYGDAKQEQFKIREEDLRLYAPFLYDLWGSNKDDMADAAMYAYEKLKNKLEERKMKNVNETKNQNHTFAIERNYDETDRKLFRLEDAETGDFIRIATDEERLIYMVVNIYPVKSRLKANEKSGVWCVCIQTQDLVELPCSEMVYVYDPRYIAFRIGRFIDA